jgi:hypothetical protein
VVGLRPVLAVDVDGGSDPLVAGGEAVDGLLQLADVVPVRERRGESVALA